MRQRACGHDHDVEENHTRLLIRERIRREIIKFLRRCLQDAEK